MVPLAQAADHPVDSGGDAAELVRGVEVHAGRKVALLHSCQTAEQGACLPPDVHGKKQEKEQIEGRNACDEQPQFPPAHRRGGRAFAQPHHRGEQKQHGFRGSCEAPAKKLKGPPWAMAPAS
jgi:hypothetical protein